jgi:Rps23 Pro-64 3,4-dihydroxylase Tpa1-like proline 4-hydroxylase
MTREEIVRAIEQRLADDAAAIERRFRESANAVGTRHVSIPDLLPPEMAAAIHAQFPSRTSMRRLRSWNERKYTSKNLRSTPLIDDATFAFQDLRIVRLVERITGMRNMLPDERLYAGGISAMERGDYLHPHIDNSHDSERALYRRLNLLYYITPQWQVEGGGNLELWNEGVTHRVTIPSTFNTLVLMETNKRSWHSVSEVRAEGLRCCISNYYFSRESPDGGEYFHITYFSAPPEKPLRRLLAKVDGTARTLLRHAKKRGFAPKDYHR